MKQQISFILYFLGVLIFGYGIGELAKNHTLNPIALILGFTLYAIGDNQNE